MLCRPSRRDLLMANCSNGWSRPQLAHLLSTPEPYRAGTTEVVHLRPWRRADESNTRRLRRLRLSRPAGPHGPVPSMVGLAGFEPTTPASRTQCSTKLSHNPSSRDGRIRTDGRAAPSRVLYQAELRPDVCPRRESNPDLRFRRPTSCPLDHVGLRVAGWARTSASLRYQRSALTSLATATWRKGQGSNLRAVARSSLAGRRLRPTRPPFHSADEGTRTPDRPADNRMLWPLSYASMVPGEGFEPPTCRL
jgi:hypothetical protein